MALGIFFASHLIANQELANYVKEQMGHSSIKVTFDTYGHLFPGRGREASQRYERSMEQARKRSEKQGVSKDVSKGSEQELEGTATACKGVVAGGGFEPPTFGL